MNDATTKAPDKWVNFGPEGGGEEGGRRYKEDIHKMLSLSHHTQAHLSGCILKAVLRLFAILRFSSISASTSDIF